MALHAPKRLMVPFGMKYCIPLLSKLYSTNLSLEKPRILVTGAMGQLGRELATMFRTKYGRDNVIMSDIVKPPRRMWMEHSPYLYIDVLDMPGLEATVVNYQIDWLVHFSAILSAVGEQNVPLALKINIEGLHNVLEVSRQHSLRLFVPSTIGAFGVGCPRQNTPDITIQRPRTIYGVSKVHGELLGEYFNHRFGTDFRCLRFPGVISADLPGGGTTDYAVQIFYDALIAGKHECYLRPDTVLPMMYIEDCLRSVVELMETPSHLLKQRTYNLASYSFTPEQLAEGIRKYVPHFEINYKVCPVRQAIADSWPESLDDSGARQDWGWNPRYCLDATVTTVLDILTNQGIGPSNRPHLAVKA